MKQYVNIGKMVASYGINGHMILSHNLGKKTSLKGLDVLFIEETKEIYIPYFIESVKAHGNTEVLVKLEGIDSKEAAKKLYPKKVWFSEEQFRKYAAKSSPVNLLGFELINLKTSIGKIEEVIEQPHQLLCVVIINNKEALIPIHDENLLQIDQKLKKVFVSLPDGLLEVYQ